MNKLTVLILLAFSTSLFCAEQRKPNHPREDQAGESSQGPAKRVRAGQARARNQNESGPSGSVPEPTLTLQPALAAQSVQRSPKEPKKTDEDLLKAARLKDPAKVLAAIAAGANVNCTYLKGMGNTPLHYACKYGNIQTIKALVENGANVNAQDHYGWTPLMHAIGHGFVERVQYFERVKYLVKHGADVNAQDHHGETPLTHAITWNMDETAHYLVEHGAVFNSRDWHHINDPDLSTVRIALRLGAPINTAQAQRLAQQIRNSVFIAHREECARKLEHFLSLWLQELPKVQNEYLNIVIDPNAEVERRVDAILEQERDRDLLAKIPQANLMAAIAGIKAICSEAASSSAAGPSQPQ